MAIYESSLFHKLNKSIGNVVAYSYCDKGVLRSKPLHIYNPKTLAQQQARLRFKSAGRLSAYFSKVAPVGFPAPYASRSHNAFIRANIRMFDVDESLQVHADFRRLACSGGKQVKPLVSLKISGRNVTVEIAKQKISAYCFREDRVYLVLWENKQKESDMHFIGERSCQQSYTFSLPDSWNSAYLFAYAFAVSVNGKQASDTVLLSEEKQSSAESGSVG